MYIKFEKHEQKLTAALAAIPALALTVSFVNGNPHWIMTLVAAALSFCAFNFSLVHGNTASIAASSAIFGVCFGLLQTVNVDCQHLVFTAITPSSAPINTNDVMFAISVILFAALATFIRFTRLERAIPAVIASPSYKVVVVTFIAGIALDVVGLQYPLVCLCLSIPLLMVIGRNKDSICLYQTSILFVFMQALTM